MDLALAAFAEKKLGRGPATDVLAVSLSATDYVGHSTGTVLKCARDRGTRRDAGTTCLPRSTRARSPIR